MSKELNEIDEAELDLSSVAGEIAGLKRAMNHLKDKSSQAFLKNRDEEAKLLRTLAGHFYQDIEVLDVKRIKLIDQIRSINEKEK